MSEEIKNEQVTEDIQPDEQPKVEKSAEKTYSEAEYNALKSQIENLKQSAKDNEDFRKKFEQSEQARKDFEHKTKVSAFVKNLNLKDEIYENHVENLILEKGLKFDGDKLIGGDDVVNTFKEKYSYAFKSDEQLPKFTSKTKSSVTATTDDSILRSVMGLN